MPLENPPSDDASLGALTRVHHQLTALDRLAIQFRDKPLLAAFLSIYAEQTQELEDALWQLVSLRTLPAAEGAQLDVIGRILGLPRGSFDDDTYRLHIGAQIRVNNSSGTAEELIAVFTTIGSTGTTAVVREFFPATVRVELETVPQDPDTISYLANFLRRAKAGGIQTQLQWAETTPENTFSFLDGEGLGFGDSTTPATGGQLTGVIE